MSNKCIELIEKITRRGMPDQYYFDLLDEIHEYFEGDYPQDEKDRMRFGHAEMLEMICSGITYRREQNKKDN